MHDIQYQFATTFLWKLKMRLQWTGLLPYLPNAIFVMGCFATSALLPILDSPQSIVRAVQYCGLCAAALLVFDLCTIKLKLRPPEPKPPRNEHLNVLEIMRLRRSCCSFQSRILTPEDRSELRDVVLQQMSLAARLGAQVVRLEYVAMPLRVWPEVGVHEFLVVVAPKEYSAQAVVDVGRCLQKVVCHGTAMGVATYWIGPGADQASVVRHLGPRFSAATDHITCICAVGYASFFKPIIIRIMELAQHCRLPLHKLFYADALFTRPLDVTQAPFQRFGRCFEVCQWAPSSFNAQQRAMWGWRGRRRASCASTSMPQTPHASTRSWRWASGSITGRRAAR